MADKKLAKKLAKMTEEERAIFLEQQRLQEEEGKKKKEEMLSRFLRNKLVEEEKATKVNMLKVQRQWRTLMRKVKAEELAHEIEVMQQTFERMVDRKDALIQSIAKDLEEAEEQYQIALRTHFHKVTDFVDFQKRRTTDLEKQYTEELSVIQEEFDTERELMKKRHDKEMRDLKDIIYAMELRNTDRETEAAQNFQSLMDELKNKNLENTHALNAQRKATLDELWMDFQKETKQYKDSTEERKLRFEALKKKDEESSSTISRQMRKLHKLQETIASLRHKMAINAKETEEKTKAIKQDREVLLSHFRALKKEMIACREAEKSNLTKLTLQSDAAIQEVQRKRDLVERVLRLAEMCRKLETEEEKVLPFYSSSLEPKGEQEGDEFEAAPPSEPLAQIMQEYMPLKNFWKRYNKVLLDKLSLDREKLTLESENFKLKAILKQYLDGISVNDEVLSRSNPLIMSGKKEPLPRRTVPVGDPRVEQLPLSNPNVVEASLVAKNII